MLRLFADRLPRRHRRRGLRHPRVGSHDRRPRNGWNHGGRHGLGGTDGSRGLVDSLHALVAGAGRHGDCGDTMAIFAAIAPPPTPAAVPAAAPPPIVGRPIAADALGAPLKIVSENGNGGTARPLKARRRFSPSAATRAQLGHSSRWATSRLRSLRLRRPSVCCERASVGAIARDEVLEFLGERASRPEDQRFERCLGDLRGSPRSPCTSAPPSPGGRVLPLRLRNSLQRADGRVLDRGSVVVGLERGNIAVELDLSRPRLLLAEALPDQVVRDRDQPVRRLARLLAPLERAQGVHECRLRDVLGIGSVAKNRVDVAVDLRRVGAIEFIQVGFGLDPGRSGGHHSVDARWSALSLDRTKSLQLGAQVVIPHISPPDAI